MRFNLARSGHQIHTFGAPDLATAQTAAQSFATLFGLTNVELHPHTEATPGDGQKIYRYNGAAQGGTVSAPSGVGLGL